jgi:hypothetical protein
MRQNSVMIYIFYNYGSSNLIDIPLLLDDIICIDETSIKSLQKRNHCYNEIGKRCVIKT